MIKNKLFYQKINKIHLKKIKYFNKNFKFLNKNMLKNQKKNISKKRNEKT